MAKRKTIKESLSDPILKEGLLDTILKKRCHIRLYQVDNIAHELHRWQAQPLLLLRLFEEALHHHPLLSVLGRSG